MKNDSYKELANAAWRVSVDAREKVRGEAEQMFGKGAEWTRSFDFQRPVEGYYGIKGFRFMSDDEKTRMFVIRHDGSLEVLPEKPEEKFVDKMMSELELAKNNPTRICGWLDPNRQYPAGCKAMEAGPGFYLMRYEDLSGSLRNSSGQRVPTPMDRYDCILDFKYAGKADGKEHFAYEVADYGNRVRSYGLFDVNGREAYFPHINEYENADRLVPAVCESFQEMVREQEEAQMRERHIGKNPEMDLGETRGIKR